MATADGSTTPAGGSTRRLKHTAQVIIVGSVMFTFISYWRTAAVVLCDLASTAYYIGGIVEQAIGKAAPWFILAVMLFSYAVRSVYIESCSLFVRGGVYRVVKEAMGGFLAKLSVSALMFDYILTGPTSGVSAGQYIVGLAIDSLNILSPNLYRQLGLDYEGTSTMVKNWGAVLIACLITVYFFRQNLIGIHESSDKALKIMLATTVMAVVILVWCGITLYMRGGPVNPMVFAPNLNKKTEFAVAARYRVTEHTLRALAEDGLPKRTLDALAALQGQEFASEAQAKQFESDVEKLAPGQKREQRLILLYSRMVDQYLLTDSVLAKLTDDGVSPAVVNKLSAIKDKPYESLDSFEHRLTQLLPPEEWAQSKLDILDDAAVVETKDRVTGELRAEWARDPVTKQLLPALDKDGNPKPVVNALTGRQEDPLGYLGRFPGFARKLREPGHWWGLIGIIGLFIAFGHSILAMSGEETLAQVYREVESPKMPNFKKAAFIVFVYSLLLTASISFLAVMLIPDEVRMKDYKDNLIGGLAMYVIGPDWARLLLNAFVVFIGFLILAGAVNTALIGSNGVLNRVSEDGVLPDWFLKPHPRYGTTYRLLYLIIALQLLTILVSRGDMYVLGEAYAFGVVWSFVFKALAMVVLRFKDRSPREFKVPLNIRVGNIEVPIGLSLIFLVLLFTATLNFFTKEVATVGGVGFTLVFLVTFMASEHYHERRLKGVKHEHLEQFHEQTADEITPASLGMNKTYRKLVAIRSPQNLFMLEKALAETDPETTGVVVMTAKVTPAGNSVEGKPDLDSYDQHLMTAVVQRAEKAGKQVKPLIVPTNNPLYAVIRTAKDLQAHELVMGASNKYTADEQLEQIAFYWISMHDGQPAPLTVRILGRDRDVHLDLGGGNRIPKISERKARSVAELRAAGVGVDRVLLVHDGTPASSDLFQAVLTMLDPDVGLALFPLVPPGSEPLNGHGLVQQDQQRAKQLGRELSVYSVDGEPGGQIVRVALEGHYDLIILALPTDLPAGPNMPLPDVAIHVLRQAHCRVFLAAPPTIPQEPEKEPA